MRTCTGLTLNRDILVAAVGSLLACRAGGLFLEARAEEDAKSLPKTGSGDQKAGVDLQMPASCGGLQRKRTKMVAQDNSRWTGDCLAMRLALAAVVRRSRARVR